MKIEHVTDILQNANYNATLPETTSNKTNINQSSWRWFSGREGTPYGIDERIRVRGDERAASHLHTEGLLSLRYPVVESNRKTRDGFTFSPPVSQT